VVERGRSRLQVTLPGLLEDAANGLTAAARALLDELWKEWQQCNTAIGRLQQRIASQAQSAPAARRLMAIKGVAETIATALVAHAGDGCAYRNGRHFAANLGLVPRERSSGGQQTLGPITKRGNRYLRRLLIQGAWSVVRHAECSQDRLSRWARQVLARRGKYKAVVAVANKLARISWSMLYHQAEYRSA
jgi:transposase